MHFLTIQKKKKKCKNSVFNWYVHRASVMPDLLARANSNTSTLLSLNPIQIWENASLCQGFAGALPMQAAPEM